MILVSFVSCGRPIECRIIQPPSRFVHAFTFFSMFVFNSVQAHVNFTPVELWMLLANLTLHIVTVIVECTAIACTARHATMLTSIGVHQYEHSPHRR